MTEREGPGRTVAPGEGILDRLEERDLETVTLAVRMGYYESPRQCTMEDIAEALGITKSAVYHRMSKVERRVLEDLLAVRAEGADGPRR